MTQQLHFEGHSIEKYQAKFSGTIDLEEEEAAGLALDRVVVFLVASRVSRSEFEVLQEGDIRKKSTLAVSDATVLSGEIRDQAILYLSGGGNQGNLDFGMPRYGGSEDAPKEPEEGEISYIDDVRHVYLDGVWEEFILPSEQENVAKDDGPKVGKFTPSTGPGVETVETVDSLRPAYGGRDEVLAHFLEEG